MVSAILQDIELRHRTSEPGLKVLWSRTKAWIRSMAAEMLRTWTVTVLEALRPWLAFSAFQGQPEY